MFFSCFLLLLALNVLSAGRVPQPENRIIGGSSIEIEQVPWQVSLQFQGQHICGGSIYSKDIIITAAHCRFTKEGRRLEAKDFKIRVGSALKNSGGRLVQVAAIKSFEMYVLNTTENDIAVMRLSEPLEFTNKVQTISLADKNPDPGTPAFVSGWGATSAQYKFLNGLRDVVYTYPINLQGVRIQINKPINIFGGLLASLRQDLITAGAFGQSTCSGDSGGPLVVNQQLVGVVSSGLELCDAEAAFISVPYFQKWILHAIKYI
ncbi:trypsin alpha-like [Drosophila subpulchrella]|uniref:trypsin alpha-like n=1 Tax=Drosophila subpulchrella TaxID=1486046 RepID=UPI0018A18C9A|nr:trypsin alpha-like [Drosophila subpulchrella]